MIGMFTGARRNLYHKHLIRYDFFRKKELTTFEISMKYVEKIYSLRMLSDTKRQYKEKARLKKLQGMITFLLHITFRVNIQYSLKSLRDAKIRKLYGL